MYSDSAVADIVCPFESGRLGEPVEISWSTADSGGNRVGPITNATNEVYLLEEEDNRILHVNISTLGPLGYQCAGSVEICRHCAPCMQSPPSRSPTFVVLPIGKLCINLYTKYIVLCVHCNTFFNIQIVSVSISQCPLVSLWINMKVLPFIIVLQLALVISSLTGIVLMVLTVAHPAPVAALVDR